MLFIRNWGVIEKAQFAFICIHFLAGTLHKNIKGIAHSMECFLRGFPKQEEIINKHEMGYKSVILFEEEGLPQDIGLGFTD